MLVSHERLGEHIRVSSEDVDDAAGEITRVQHLRRETSVSPYGVFWLFTLRLWHAGYIIYLTIHIYVL